MKSGFLRGFISTTVLLLTLCPVLLRGDINVPSDYPTIQSAINAANPGDVIHLAAGRYAETLFINKNLTVAGSGTNNCVVYTSTNIPLINIAGPASVTLSNFEVNGGNYLGGNYNGVANYGITATNANVVLNNIVVNQIINYMVTVSKGSLAATNVALWTRDLLIQCDIGVELQDSSGSIFQLTQDGGRIDHTIDITTTTNNFFANVMVNGCRIRLSRLSYGNCVRTYVNSTVSISNCYLYRGAGETVPSYPAFNHSAISVNGFSITVRVAGNVISNAPWAFYIYGSPGLAGNKILIQSNTMLNSTIGGVALDGMSNKGLDMGGGQLGSAGGNVFVETQPPPANFVYDFLLTNSSLYPSSSQFAINNTWSNPNNKEAVIYDRLDNPTLGRVISDGLKCKSSRLDASHHPVLTWNERNAGEQYTVETCGDITSGKWSAAPGSWPITNHGSGDMTWTDPASFTTNSFFRLRSYVP